MYPKSIQKLIDLFAKFPGIGPRQAGRFAFFLLRQDEAYLKELASTLSEIKNKTALCQVCFQAVEKNGSNEKIICEICSNPKRDHSAIAVVEKEADLRGLEKSGTYMGLYHVLGGVVSPLDHGSPKRLRLKELHERIKNNLENGKKTELILATNATTEGDTTALYIEKILSPFKENYPEFKISRLGRGLSLGSELEYADEVTVKNAFLNRK